MLTTQNMNETRNRKSVMVKMNALKQQFQLDTESDNIGEPILTTAPPPQLHMASEEISVADSKLHVMSRVPVEI